LVNFCKFFLMLETRKSKVAILFLSITDYFSNLFLFSKIQVVPFFTSDTQLYAVHYAVNISEFGIISSHKIYDNAWDLKSKYLDFSELYCTPKTLISLN